MLSYFPTFRKKQKTPDSPPPPPSSEQPAAPAPAPAPPAENSDTPPPPAASSTSVPEQTAQTATTTTAAAAATTATTATAESEAQQQRSSPPAETGPAPPAAELPTPPLPPRPAAEPAAAVAPAVEAAGATVPLPIEESTKAQAVDAPLPGEKSPVLSAADESFISTALSSAEEEPPAVIFEGADSGTTTGATTPNGGGGAVSGAASPKEGERKERTRTEEWKVLARTQWDGLKRSASTAMERRKAGSGKEKEKEKDKKEKGKGKGKDTETEDKGKGKEIPVEEEKEARELRAALDGLSLAAENGRAFSLSLETKAILDHFVQILKDIGAGVPTAYDDLTTLLEGSSAQLESTFKSLPSFLQKLVRTLPTKLSSSLSPELLRASAAAAPAAAAEGITLKELVAKPGMIMGLLKSVVNVLKTRFPAFMGANLAVSMGLFLVLLVLWYCYKRGREERLAKEAALADALLAADLDADAAVPSSSVGVDAPGRAVSSGVDLGPGAAAIDGHIPAGGAGKVSGSKPESESAPVALTDPAKDVKVE